MVFPAQFNLSDLNGSNGFILSDFSGTSVSSAGDVNGDGIDDLLLGAAGADPDGINNAGESYVVFGKDSNFDANLVLAELNGDNGFVIKGTNESELIGASVSNAGDINADGIDDLIIGGVSSNAKTYVVFGKNSGFSPSLALSDIDGSNGFSVTRTQPSNSAKFWNVSNAGDINNDSIDDLFFGEYIVRPGYGYVLFGSSSGFSDEIDLSQLNGNDGFEIIADGFTRLLGSSLSNAGDINADGIDDLIIGASYTDIDGVYLGGGPTPLNEVEGEAYVLFGKNGSFAPDFQLSNLDGNNGFAIPGIKNESRLGSSSSNAGDINADGIDDLIVANARDKIYVLFGKNTEFNAEFDLNSLDGSNGFALTGLRGSLNSVSNAGDVNGDSIDDFIVGSPNTSGGRGAVYVVFGNDSGFEASINVQDINGDNGFVINGLNRGDFLGRMVSNAGDINADDIDDLIFKDSNRSYVIFGSSDDIVDAPLVTVNGTAITNDVESYGGNQDNSDTGTVTVSPSNQLNITGNRWQRVEINSTITPNTILSFTFTGNNAEVQGIGFDNDNNIRRVDDAGHFFQVAGSQSWGIENISQFSTVEDGKQVYTIPVGQFFTGDFDFLTFANDDDEINPDAQAQFSNIELFEGTANLLGISINGVNQDKEFTLYGGVEQNAVITSTVNDGTELELSGNNWRKIDITGFEITQSTTLEFEFRSNGAGEVQGIGFDNDNNIRSVDDARYFFQVAGSQSWGIEDLSDYIVGSSDGFTQYSIDVGDFFTGEFDFLTFANDHDVANPTAVAQFRNISLNA
ncbi:MAG: integrin alpha [Cyanobacteria bacterium J06643_5]